MKKRSVCILYGGKSGEHEVSLRSAASVARNLDPARYALFLIGIDKAGAWFLQKDPAAAMAGHGPLPIADRDAPVSILPGTGFIARGVRLDIDVVFPVLHGSFGEDGTVQGLLELCGLPYVGPGVMASSVAMDKDRTKRLWREAGLPVLESATVRKGDPLDAVRAAARSFGYPVCVKPVSCGSSVGVSRVPSEERLAAALSAALKWDLRAMVEPFVAAREIECSVIGNSRPRSFPPGEIVPTHEFYDYEAKYKDPDGARLEAPARLPAELARQVRDTAERAYAVLGCEGMARVDFFLMKDSGELFLNELNTIPGFTDISMFPRMCQASGLPYAALLDTLITLALERREEKAGLATSYPP